jgi:predicted DNA-binding transcriptional regulator AlpA
MPRTRLTPKLKHRHHRAKPTLAEQISTPPPPAPRTIQEQVDVLFDVTGLSRYLGVEISWVYEHTARGSRVDIPFVKIGRFLKFRKSSIDAWLASRERQQEIISSAKK